METGLIAKTAKFMNMNTQICSQASQDEGSTITGLPDMQTQAGPNALLPKRDEDMISSAWKHAAAISGARVAILHEDNEDSKRLWTVERRCVVALISIATNIRKRVLSKLVNCKDTLRAC